MRRCLQSYRKCSRTSINHQLKLLWFQFQRVCTFYISGSFLDKNPYLELNYNLKKVHYNYYLTLLCRPWEFIESPKRVLAKTFNAIWFEIMVYSWLNNFDQKTMGFTTIIWHRESLALMLVSEFEQWTSPFQFIDLRRPFRIWNILLIYMGKQQTSVPEIR